MGVYDTFWSKDEKVKAQLKCFDSGLHGYTEGDEVPVEEFDYPRSCTFCDWGGTSAKYKSYNIMHELQTMGKFVVIENGKVKYVTEDETLIIKPVFDKYGCQLDEEIKGSGIGGSVRR